MVDIVFWCFFFKKTKDIFQDFLKKVESLIKTLNKLLLITSAGFILYYFKLPETGWKQGSFLAQIFLQKLLAHFPK